MRVLLALWSLADSGFALSPLAAVPSPAPPSLAARFANPPAEARIFKIIHGWPDDPQAQDDLIHRLQRQGFGGVVCNVSFDDYLESDAKWTVFLRAVAEAKRAGMALWLYDERGYPSGNAGGLVLRDHPEWEAQGLLAIHLECTGGDVELRLPPGRLVLAATFPIVGHEVNLEAKRELRDCVRNDLLRWTAPEGRWCVLAVTESVLYEGTHAEGNLWQKMPYVNLLLPEPTARFLDLTHQRYATRFGGDLGRFFVATFTDEPSLLSCFLKSMPYRPLPWAPNLPVEFEKRRGYALTPELLPALMVDAGVRSAQVRSDFWRTVGELVSENFFGQIQDRCRTYQIPSGGHLLMEESLVAHVPLYGDFFRCARRLDAPSIDCLTSLPPEVPWFIARLMASAAELEGHRLVMCETSDHAQVWRPPGDSRPKRVVTEAEIRGTCNRLIVSGVNTITSYYSFTGLGDDALRRLNDWVGRCCLLLTGGHQIADVALLYPIESVWPKFTPARLWANESPAATQIEHLYRAAADSLFQAQRDFTVVDSRTLVEAKAEAGALVQGPLRWRVLVLPGADTLPLAAWENLTRFVAGGGVVVALGALPANSESEFPSRRVQALGREIFAEPAHTSSVHANRAGGAGIFLPIGSEALLPLVLDGVVDRDVRLEAARSPIRVTHRRIDGHELYLCINDSGQSWDDTASFAAVGPGEEWDPATGRLAHTNLAARVRLRLEPYGAVLLRFPAARVPVRRAPATGPLPNLNVRDLPAVSPSVAHGEFVRARLVPRSAQDTRDSASWQAEATLTKGQVDTFLFVRFPFDQPLDLEGSDCLIIDTWVPEHQTTPTQILVIVQEKNGGDFIASTGRSLASAGFHRAYVPVSQLQLAGWSRDSDGQLDLRQVAEIRVGWGGYYGTSNEPVVFGLAPPRGGWVRFP